MKKSKVCITEVAVLVVIIACCQSSTVNMLFNISSQRNSSEERQEQAVQELLQRLIPDKSDQFEIEIDFNSGTKDFFKISSKNDEVFILGNKGYSAAAGVHYYLKNFCRAHISWSGNQLDLPDYLPRPSHPTVITMNDKYRYYQNVCTSSYSYVWWSWSRWEKEIDWMALNGINLPLAFTAQEAIFSKVFRDLNFTEHDIGTFFTGPAYLAWNRMGNLQTWIGPLTDNWHKAQVKLQHRILQRMREFGMTPVLPAFSGRVVPAFNREYPNASTAFLAKNWGHFVPPLGRVMFLQPKDPMFHQIGVTFLRNYIEEFGTDHVYSADLFNELPPPSNDTNYLAECASFLYRTITTVDPDAIWITQGWMFFADPEIWQPPQARAFLTAVPLGKMIVLDLQSEMYPQYPRLSSYYGQPFIWCMLHNYGGVTGLYGSLEQVNNGTFEGRNFEGSTMIGTGLTPEGIETNDLVYELMNEMSWRKEPVNLNTWLTDYSIRRYGKSSRQVVNALLFLKRSVYNATAPYRNHGKYILIRRPSFRLKPFVWYNPKDVFKAWRYFLNASDDIAISNSKLYKHDLVDITRQCLQLSMDVFYNQYVKNYRQQNVEKTKEVSEMILQLYDDMDEILSSDEHFLLGKWLYDAKLLSVTPLEERQYEYNARNQITLWGPAGEILDYANKQWAGLMKDYYKMRWQLFFKSAESCISNSSSFNQASFNNEVFNKVETVFDMDTKIYPKVAIGDSVEISKRLFQKYYYVKNLFGKFPPRNNN